MQTVDACKLSFNKQGGKLPPAKHQPNSGKIRPQLLGFLLLTTTVLPQGWNKQFNPLTDFFLYFILELLNSCYFFLNSSVNFNSSFNLKDDYTWRRLQVFSFSVPLSILGTHTFICFL